MKNKITIILSVVGFAVLCVAATHKPQSGGLPAHADRLTALESVVLAQDQEIEALKQQVATMQPSPFTDTEAGRLKDLVSVIWVSRGQGGQWDTEVLVDGNLLVRQTCAMRYTLSRGGNFTDSWTVPNAAGWMFR